ncbi:hypothetical protein [Parvicella tangerina]|uniref:Uncharacterized protein n=1 Tax=Parvicella tangerina TaxID=2829795 RepID=A0A916JMI1_9FLAO|nr:hypothetical protein [Parvicella tangerina]CAG5083132.1 hypothetical protein CRYO30217_02097 [Parvicella tangerina]
MKRLLLSAMVALTALSSFATELSYKWKSGAAYHFTAVVNDDVSTSMMGMEMKEQFKTTTDFVLYINSVASDGKATGMLYLVNFSVIDSKGNALASLNDLPQKALQSEVTVDAKGKFTFLKKIYLITSGSSNVLAYGSADANSVSAGGQAGNMKVDAYAEFDPKTGSLKAGYSVKEIKNTSTVEVKVTEETDMIDVLPYDFLELLALPEGDVNLNDEVKVGAGMYETVVKVNDMSAGVASLHHTMSTDKSKDMFDGSASGTSGDGSSSFGMGMDTQFEDGDSDNDGDFDMDMNTDMEGMDMDMQDFDDEMSTGDDMGMGGMDMGGFGMPGSDAEAIGASKSMAPDMGCDVTSKFDYQNGMFDKVYGTVTTNMNTMGMKMNVVSKLEMVLNK